MYINYFLLILCQIIWNCFAWWGFVDLAFRVYYWFSSDKFKYHGFWRAFKEIHNDSDLRDSWWQDFCHCIRAWKIYKHFYGNDFLYKIAMEFKAKQQANQSQATSQTKTTTVETPVSTGRNDYFQV